MAHRDIHEVPAPIAELINSLGINPDDIKISVVPAGDVQDHFQEEQPEDNFNPFKERLNNMKPFIDHITGGLAAALASDEDAVDVNSDAAYEYREGDDLTIVFDAPGLDEDTIKVTYDEAGITVTGERFYPGADQEDSKIEILYSNVETELELFHGLEIDEPEKLDVNFDYENGSISVTLVGFSAAPKVYEAARKSATKKAEPAKK